MSAPPSATKYHIWLSTDAGSAGLGNIPVSVLSRRHRYNHQRAYFNIGIAQNTGVCKTSMRSPLAAQSNMHFSSLPAMGMLCLSQSPTRDGMLSPGLAWYVEHGRSEESTSRSSCPARSSVNDPFMCGFMRAATERGEPHSLAEIDNYKVFQNNAAVLSPQGRYMQRSMLRRRISAYTMQLSLSPVPRGRSTTAHAHAGALVPKYEA